MHRKFNQAPSEREQIDDVETDPLAALDRHTTKILDNFYTITPDDNEAYASMTEDEEWQAVEEFLNHQ